MGVLKPLIRMGGVNYLEKIGLKFPQPEGFLYFSGKKLELQEKI